MRRFISFIKKRRKASVAIAAILIILLVIIFRPRAPKQIETQRVQKGDIVESLSTTGTIDSTSAVNMNFLAAGKLVYVGVKRGDAIAAGDTIAVLDQRSMHKNLETALRDYSIQRNTFDQTREDNQNRTPREALNDRMKRILETNQYDLDKAVLSVELQDLAREQSVLVSPITGIVTRADVTTAGVNIGTTTTYSVADPANLLFRMEVDEADINKVRLGERVKVTLNAYPEQPLELQITSVDFAAHETSIGGNAYTVEAALPDNSELVYRIGMNGDAEIISSEKTDILKIPLAGLTDDNSVYVKSGDTYIKRKVVTGVQSDTESEVVSGLKEGEVVANQPDEAANIVKEKQNKKRFFFF